MIFIPSFALNFNIYSYFDFFIINFQGVFDIFIEMHFPVLMRQEMPAAKPAFPCIAINTPWFCSSRENPTLPKPMFPLTFQNTGSLPDYTDIILQSHLSVPVCADL